MRYNRILLSTIALTIISGCVKPTEEVNTQRNTTDATVYDEQPNEVVYGDDASSEPIVYADPMTTDTTTTTTSATVNDGIYNSEVEDNTVVTPPVTDTYQQTTTATTVPSASDHYQPPTGGYSPPTASGAYSDPYSAGGGDSYSSSSSGGGYSAIDDPYAPSSSSSNTYSSNNNRYSSSSSSSSRYSTNLPYGTSSSSSYGSSSGTQKKGIQLQVAALRDYYAAEEFRKGLSLNPKYGSYVKRGPINKVIITGIPTRAEAKALAARQFPGAFIVGGTETSSSYSGGSSYTAPSYTPPTSSYTPPSYSSSTGNINSGIGVQVGAFSSKEKARAIAQEKSAGQYTAVVKTAQVRGRTMYKAILLGFATREEAKRAIASGRFGDAFVVTGIHP